MEERKKGGNKGRRREEMKERRKSSGGTNRLAISKSPGLVYFKMHQLTRTSEEDFVYRE